MSSLISWIKKELDYLGDSIPDILRGFVFFLLAFSGFGIALILRYLEFNGTIIASVGIITEGISMFITYLFFKGYLKVSEEKTPDQKRIKK